MSNYKQPLYSGLFINLALTFSLDETRSWIMAKTADVECSELREHDKAQ